MPSHSSKKFMYVYLYHVSDIWSIVYYIVCVHRSLNPQPMTLFSKFKRPRLNLMRWRNKHWTQTSEQQLQRCLWNLGPQNRALLIEKTWQNPWFLAKIRRTSNKSSSKMVVSRSTLVSDNRSPEVLLQPKAELSILVMQTHTIQKSRLISTVQALWNHHAWQFLWKKMTLAPGFLLDVVSAAWWATETKITAEMYWGN